MALIFDFDAEADAAFLYFGRKPEPAEEEWSSLCDGGPKMTSVVVLGGAGNRFLAVELLGVARLLHDPRPSPTMRYDAARDVARIFLGEVAGAGGANRAVPANLEREPDALSCLYDQHDRLIGLKILDASRLLEAGVLATDGVEQR